MTNVLLVTPRLDRPGGVAHYYRSLQMHLVNRGVEYCYVGDDGEPGRFRAFYRLLRDYLYFAIRLFNPEIKLVHLNPSLFSNSVIRDAVYVLTSKLFGKKLIVFFRYY